MALRLTVESALGAQSTGWYRKEEVTFSDVLAYVGRALWAEKYFSKSTVQGEQVLLRVEVLDGLLDQLATTA